MTQARPLLYSFRRCPYAMRARMGLYAARKVVELREIMLRDKPAHMLEISPKGTVPVLLLPQGRVIEESVDIMLWALEQNDPDGWLEPRQQNLPAMLALIEQMDRDFKHHLDRYKYASRYEDVDGLAHRGRALDELSLLANRLAVHSQLFGERIGLADIALFPFVRQFANVDRGWFDEAAPVSVRSWLEGHEGSALFASIFHKWPVWRDGDPVTLFPEFN